MATWKQANKKQVYCFKFFSLGLRCWARLILGWQLFQDIALLLPRPRKANICWKVGYYLSRWRQCEAQMLPGICHVLFYPVSTRHIFSLECNFICFPRTFTLKSFSSKETQLSVAFGIFLCRQKKEMKILMKKTFFKLCFLLIFTKHLDWILCVTACFACLTFCQGLLSYLFIEAVR